MQIYVITHKKIDIELPKNYKKMLVGACENSEALEEYIFDNKGQDNISKKNSNFCELTGLYWIWKYDKDNTKGLVHYRRLFTNNRFTNSYKKFFSQTDVESILKSNDVIVAEKLYIDKLTVKADYLENHKEEDWMKLKDIIAEHYPSYLSIFEQVEKNNWFYPYNMMISHKELFDSYCEWLFDILFKLEKEIDLTGYDVQQARIYGFMSERLLAVWLLKNNYKIYEAPVVQLDCRFRYRIRRALEKMFERRVKFGGR